MRSKVAASFVIAGLLLLATGIPPRMARAQQTPQRDWLTLDQFRSLLDQKVAVRTTYGLRDARAISDTEIGVVIGMSVTGVCRDPKSYRIVSFDDDRYAFKKFVNPVAAAATSHVEAKGPAGCPYSEFKRTLVTLKAPYPFKKGARYYVLARGQNGTMVTAAHSAQSFVYGADSEPRPYTTEADMAAMGLRRLKPVGPQQIEAVFGPNFAPGAGDKPTGYALRINDAPVEPVRMGRFSRVDTYLPEGWPFKAIPEHEVFFELPQPLQDGDVVELKAEPDVTGAASEATLHFDSRKSYTDSVKVNQVGYLTLSPVKWAYLGRWMGSMGALSFRQAPAEFWVCNAEDGQVVWRGRPQLRHQAGNFNEGVYKKDLSGENVYVLDFTPFQTPGNYFIAVPGVGRSFEFRIADDVYNEAFQAVAHGVFIQRCGIELKPPYSNWRRIACHKKGIQPTTIKRGGDIGAFPKNIDPSRPTIMAYGGHHDAGDYNPRSHIDVAQVLMDVYEMAPDKFYDGQLNIPEQGDGIPDVINEAAWALQLWQMLQDKDGGLPGGTESNGDPNFIQTAEMDTLGDYAYAKDTSATFIFAGAAAQAARIYKGLGKQAEANTFLQQARGAYQWATRHNPQGAKNNWAYAAAQLLHTTGEARFQNDFRRACVWSANPNAQADDATNLAAWAYACCPTPPADPQLRQAVRRAIVNEADGFIRNARTMGYAFIRHPYAPINWGTGAYENYVAPVIKAWLMTGQPEYLAWVVHTCDNTLGANPLNKSWVVDLGERTVRAPLHNSRYGSSGEVAPGLECEGPWNKPSGYRVEETYYPKFSNSFPLLYNHVDCHFAIGMDEGVVRTQANTMAAFAFMLPTRK